MELDKDKKGYVFVNLLPFREQIKKEKLKEFYLILGFFGAIALLLVFFLYSVMMVQLDSQKARNGYIDKENKKLDVEIKEISNLQEEINLTLGKRKVVERLQINRGDSVKILNEAASQLPEGMTLSEVSSKTIGGMEVVTLKGNTNSNNKVSVYMTQLVSSDVFINPVLVEIKANTKIINKTGEKSREVVNNIFQINLMLKPSVEVEEESTKTRQSKK